MDVNFELKFNLVRAINQTLQMHEHLKKLTALITGSNPASCNSDIQKLEDIAQSIQEEVCLPKL